MNHHLPIIFSTFAFCITLELQQHLLNIFSVRAIFYLKSLYLISLLVSYTVFYHCNLNCFNQYFYIYFFGIHFLEFLHHFLIMIIQIFYKMHLKIKSQSLYKMIIFLNFSYLMSTYLIESFKKKNYLLYLDQTCYYIDFQINYQFTRFNLLYYCLQFSYCLIIVFRLTQFNLRFVVLLFSINQILT